MLVMATPSHHDLRDYVQQIIEGPREEVVEQLEAVFDRLQSIPHKGVRLSKLLDILPKLIRHIRKKSSDCNYVGKCCVYFIHLLLWSVDPTATTLDGMPKFRKCTEGYEFDEEVP
jgi:hypothetical protein